MNPEKNPEKIPLNPLREEVHQTPYSTSDNEESISKSEQLMRKSIELAKLPKNTSQSRLTSKQKLVLGAVMTLMVIATAAAAVWLFGKEIDLTSLF